MTASPSLQISVLGSGWLGLPLVQALRQAGHQVRCSTASSERQAALTQTLGHGVYQVQVAPDQVTGDIGPLLEAQILIINVPPLKGQPTEEQFAALLPLVEAAAVERVLLVSSTGVYRSVQGVVTEAGGQENPDHKLYKSEQLWQGSTKVQTTVLRLAGLVGGKRHPGRFFQRRGIIPHPEAPVNLIHLDDCLAIIQAIIDQSAWGEVYNGCSDTHPTKGDFYPRAAQALGLPAPALGDGGTGVYKVVSNAKVKADLGLTLQHPDLMTLLDHWR